MIRLENIVIDNHIIKCDIFPEDSKEKGQLEINMDNSKFIATLPNGYEWCKNHVEKAKKYLFEMYDSKNYEQHKLLMWY